MVESRRIGFFIRCVALTIDLVVAAIAAVATFLLLFWIFHLPRRIEQRAIRCLFLSIFVAIMLVEFFCSRTIGKAILKVRVARSDGTHAEDSALLFRFVLKTWPAMILLLDAVEPNELFEDLGLFGLGAVAISFLVSINEGKQAWHDQLTGTAVYRAVDVDRPDDRPGGFEIKIKE